MKKQIGFHIIAMSILCVCLAVVGCSHMSGSAEASGNKTTANVALSTKPENVESSKKVTWFEKGSLKDGVYTNQQAKITISVPKGWKWLTEDQILQQTNTQYGQLTDSQKEEYKENIQNQQAITDFGAIGEDGSSFFFVVQRPSIATVNEDAYLKNIEPQLIKAKLSPQFGAITNRNLAGNTWKIVIVKINAKKLVQCYAVHKRDNRMEGLVITVPDTKEASINEILSEVSALK